MLVGVVEGDRLADAPFAPLAADRDRAAIRHDERQGHRRDGEVHHVVWDEDLSKKARGHLAAIGVDDVVRYHVAEAIASIVYRAAQAVQGGAAAVARGTRALGQRLRTRFA